MKRRMPWLSALATALLLSVGAGQAGAADAPPYGSQLMTPQERIELRDKLRAATSDADRDKIRAEHHDKMKARAAERGITLPDEPPAGGGGMGPGTGMGPGAGMGPGNGMGPGGGKGPGGGRGK